MILIADVRELDDVSLYHKAYEILPPARREKADRNTLQADKNRTVAAGILLYSAVYRYENSLQKLGYAGMPLQQQPSQPQTESQLEWLQLSEAVAQYDSRYHYEIAYTIEGKPYFKNHPNLYFNLSHSGAYAVCMIANTPVGIDIEGRRKVKPSMARRFFTDREYQWVKGDEQEVAMDENQVERFFRIWTLKEAFVKCTGIGISKGIGLVEFIPATSNKGKGEMEFADPAQARQFTIQEFGYDGYHISAVVSRKKNMD